MLLWILKGFVLFIPPFCFNLTAFADTPKQNGDARIPSRMPWTNSRIKGTPDSAPPYIVEPSFPHLSFHQPVVLTNAPGTERLFLAQVNGKIYSFPNDSNCRQSDLVVDLAKLQPQLTMLYLT